MSGPARAHDFILGRGLSAPRISGDGALHSFYVIKDALNAPEAAACKHGGSLASSGGASFVHRRSGDCCSSGRTAACRPSAKTEQTEKRKTVTHEG